MVSFTAAVRSRRATRITGRFAGRVTVDRVDRPAFTAGAQARPRWGGRRPGAQPDPRAPGRGCPRSSADRRARTPAGSFPPFARPRHPIPPTSRPTSLRRASSASNRSRASSSATEQHEVVDQPERGEQERALTGREPVDRHAAAAGIGRREPSGATSVRYRMTNPSTSRSASMASTVATMRGSSGGRKPTSTSISRLASTSVDP